MLNKNSLIIATFAVATVLAGAITMVPHSAFAHKHEDYNSYSYTTYQTDQQHYSNGYNDGFQQAQTDWNTYHTTGKVAVILTVDVILDTHNNTVMDTMQDIRNYGETGHKIKFESTMNKCNQVA